MEIGVLAALHGFEHLNLAAPDPDLGPKLELASRHHGETEHASSQAKAPQSSTPAPCSLITVRASFSSRSPANLECRRWSEGSIREIRYAPRAGVEPTSPRRRILSGISRLARQVGYARLVFLPRSRPESADPGLSFLAASSSTVSNRSASPRYPAAGLGIRRAYALRTAVMRC